MHEGHGPLIPLLAGDVIPTTDPWPWICGILAVANAAQFFTASKDRQQARQDMLAMLPAITASTKALERLEAKTP